MKRNIHIWQLIGFVAVSIGGTLLHFLYDWTGSTYAALFSGINESTWEHMKLLFFPLFLFAVVEYFFVGKDYENFFCVKLRGTLLGLLLIPVIFYTLRGVIGTTPDFVNISIFFVSTALVFLYETKQFREGSKPGCPTRWAIGGLCLIAVAFWIFTFNPPEIALFRDPVDGSFGLTL